MIHYPIEDFQVPTDDCGGAWYKIGKSNIGDIHLPEGWLCPATLLYFETMPDNIYIRIEAV